MAATELRDTDAYTDRETEGEPIARDDCSVSAAELDKPWTDEDYNEPGFDEQSPSGEPIVADPDPHCDPLDMDEMRSDVVYASPGDDIHDDDVHDHGEPVADCVSIDEEDSA
jgi:hypothetical protein